MREAIPRAQVVESGFRVLEKRLDRTRRRINSEAARCMRAGDYDAVQRWMEVGKTVSDFSARLDAFAKEWKRLVKATRIAAGTKTRPATAPRPSTARKKATPPSRFYEPAMRALAGRGGEATFEELLQDLEAVLGSDLTESDRKNLPRRGIPRWHGAVASAYRHCIREGWIENRRDRVWKLREKGKPLGAQRRASPRN